MARLPAGNSLQTIFIGNVSSDGSEDELRAFFSQVGPVNNLRVVVDRDTGQRKGFAFLEYFDPETGDGPVFLLHTEAPGEENFLIFPSTRTEGSLI